MKRLFLITAVMLFLGVSVRSQAVDCPAGIVCVPQEQFNTLMQRLDELVATKDAVAALLKERGASEAAINSALKTIEGWKELDAINNTIILKQKDVVALYEKVIGMYERVVDNLEKRLNKPKSAWSKFVGMLKTLATLLSGIALGRIGI